MDTNLKNLLADTESNLERLRIIEGNLQQCLEHLVGGNPATPHDLKTDQNKTFILTSWGNTLEEQRIAIINIESHVQLLRDVIGLYDERTAASSVPRGYSK